MTEPTRPLSSGPDSGRAPIQPESIACNCLQCRLTRIFRLLIDIAVSDGVPDAVQGRIGDIAADLSEIILKGC